LGDNPKRSLKNFRLRENRMWTDIFSGNSSRTAEEL
jgi:hypothetical protein